MKIPKKKRAMTLLEIIISVALMTALLIPAANIVMMAIRQNKESEVKQQGTNIGQSFLEKISSIDSIKEGSLSLEVLSGGQKTVLTNNSGNYILEDGTEIKKIKKDGEDAYEFYYKGETSKDSEKSDMTEIKNQKNYTVTIVPTKNTSFSDRSVSTSKNQPMPSISNANSEYDCILKLTNDYYFELTKDIDSTIYKKEWQDDEFKNPASFILLVDKDADDKIELKVYENKGTVKSPERALLPIDTIKLDDISLIKDGFKENEKILIYLSDMAQNNEKDSFYAISQTLIIQSNLKVSDSAIGKEVSEIVFDVLNTSSTTGNLDVIFDTNNGKYTHQVNYFNSKTSRIGDNYNFEVSVELNGEEIFKGETSKNIVVN